MTTAPFENYLIITENRSGETWTMQIKDDELLDIDELVIRFVGEQFDGELEVVEIDHSRTCSCADYYAQIKLNNEAPESIVCWESAGFWIS